jgi:hypothetical protein
MGLAVAVTHQQNSLQRLIDQEKKVDPTKKSHLATSPRSNVRSQKKKSHRDVQKIKDQRQTIDLSSVHFAKPVESDDSRIVSASPLSPEQKRATLPTFGEWGAQKEPLQPLGWRTSIQSPRRSIQPATPRLGMVRQDVGDAISKLVGSMADASDEQLEDALKKLQRLEGSRQNLSAVGQELVEKAVAARSKMLELEKRATDMEAQAATLQRVNEGGTPRGRETVATLRAELARRASRRVQDADAEPVECGSVEETEKREFGEQTFRSASFSLDTVLAQLEELAPTPERGLGRQKPHEDEMNIASRPLAGTAGMSGTQSSRAENKLAAHSAKYQQFRGLAKEEKAAVKKWRTELARQKLEASAGPTAGVPSTGGTPNL